MSSNFEISWAFKVLVQENVVEQKKNVSTIFKGSEHFIVLLYYDIDMQVYLIRAPIHEFATYIK